MSTIVPAFRPTVRVRNAVADWYDDYLLARPALRPTPAIRMTHLGLRTSFSCCALFAFAFAASSSSAAAPSVDSATYETTVKPFLAQHCLECHGEKAKAGYRIDRLTIDFNAATTAEQWKEVIDRINSGEMPPPEKPRPDAKQTAALTDWVHARLREVDLAAKNAGGRIPMRRLNRDEYANTLRDLLKLDEKIVRPLLEEMPSDGTAEGFDRLGAALFFDQTQIERNLDAAATIAARAIVDKPPPSNKQLNKLEFLHLRPPADTVEVFPAFAHKIPRGAPDRIVHKDVVEYIQGYPTYVRELDGWGAIESFAVPKTVVQDGYYRIKIKANIEDRGRTEPNKFRLFYAMRSPIEVEQQVDYDPSGTTETVMFLRGPVNGEVKGPQVLRLLWNHTHQSVIPHPDHAKLFSNWTRLRGAIEQAVTKREPEEKLNALRAERTEAEKALNAYNGPAYIYNPKFDVEKLPRLFLESIEVEGQIQKDWPPESHKSLFFAGDERSDDAYIREIFAKFLPRAYRRPATEHEVEAVVEVVKKAREMAVRAPGAKIDEKQAFIAAMRVGLQWVLCSPRFVFINEPAGANAEVRKLNDYELASRLSYYLWSTMPDESLFAAAAAGNLHEPKILSAQVSRMLADPKAEQFVRNFGGQWLSVREYGSVQPAAEYRDYDMALEAASKREPLEFFAEVLKSNLPITTFLDSDFLVVNERLARHYGLKDVKGPEFRRVAIGPEHHRGGVLGMTGLMTLLADGTRTLPMRRGTWILTQLLNDPPNPPPPNAGEIQPNTAGKNLTVRERIELHRRDDVCASCHTKLDPFGLALENYDAIGAWRERFNGEGFRGTNGPKLDVSGVFPDGRKFTTLEEYKAGLLAQKDRFARAFVVKMFTYALGRPVGYADHEEVDELVETLRKNDYRIQSLVQAIAASRPFTTK